MTPMERKLRNTPISRATMACNERNGGQYGVAIQRGKATLMRIDRDGRKVTQTPVAGPVSALDMAATIAMVEGYNARSEAK